MAGSVNPQEEANPVFFFNYPMGRIRPLYPTGFALLQICPEWQLNDKIYR